MADYKAPQWGSQTAPKRLHPGFWGPTDPTTIHNGLVMYVQQAAEAGFLPVFWGPTSVILERSHAQGNTGRRAGVGFLLGGFFGAVVGASTTANARTERIKIYSEENGAIYVQSI